MYECICIFIFMKERLPSWTKYLSVNIYRFRYFYFFVITIDEEDEEDNNMAGSISNRAANFLTLSCEAFDRLEEALAVAEARSVCCEL